MAYIDSMGVVINKNIPEITPDYSAGGVSAAEAMENMASAMAGVTISAEVAGEGIRTLFDSLELASAVWLAWMGKLPLVLSLHEHPAVRIRGRYRFFCCPATGWTHIVIILFMFGWTKML